MERIRLHACAHGLVKARSHRHPLQLRSIVKVIRQWQAVKHCLYSPWKSVPPSSLRSDRRPAAVVKKGGAAVRVMFGFTIATVSNTPLQAEELVGHSRHATFLFWTAWLGCFLSMREIR